MQKDQILQTAVKKSLNWGQFKDLDGYKSAFEFIHRCMCGVNIMTLSEEAKKEKLIASLQSFFRGRSQSVAGCKRDYVKQIVSFAFGIRAETGSRLHAEIRAFTFQDLYLYYCYIERAVKSDVYFSRLLYEHYRKRQEAEAEQSRKEAQEKREKQQEEERRKLDAMDQRQKWEYEIFEQKKDMVYFAQLQAGEIKDAGDKIVLAGLLKEYWIKIGKWEGNKVSKKQAAKIQSVKEILGE